MRKLLSAGLTQVIIMCVKVSHPFCADSIFLRQSCPFGLQIIQWCSSAPSSNLWLIYDSEVFKSQWSIKQMQTSDGATAPPGKDSLSLAVEKFSQSLR